MLIIDLLHLEMNTPIAYGVFHLSCLFLVFLILFILYKIKPKLNKVIFVYSSIAFLLEFLKQISWSIEVNGNAFIFDYQWYAFPFQLCTTPIYTCFLILLIKNNKIKNACYSYLAYFTILGSITTMVYPTSCFVSDVLVNIHTMWLHGGSLIVSIYILMNQIKLNYRHGFYVFLIMCIIANTLNIFIYHSSLLNGETFNMFYISPYFDCSLPIFDMIYNHTNYFVFLIIYILAIYLGSKIIYVLNKMIHIFLV